MGETTEEFGMRGWVLSKKILNAEAERKIVNEAKESYQKYWKANGSKTLEELNAYIYAKTNHTPKSWGQLSVSCMAWC